MKKSKMFWGVLFIALAVLLIVTQLGLVNIHMSIWTLLLTVFFGVSALSSLLHNEDKCLYWSKIKKILLDNK